MAQENIQVQQPNFCIAPIVGTFASVDTTNTSAQMLFKNSSGDTTTSFSFNPNIVQNTSIYYLDYIGPRNQSSIENGMVFITMESNSSSSVSIKKWNVNKDNSRLDLDYTITKTTDALDTIQCTNMAAGRYYTNLSSTTVTGTNVIHIDNTDNITVGTRLYIGPSSNTSYLNNYEEVITTAVSGTTVNIEAVDGGSVPSSYFNSGDPVTYMGNFYLFSDIGTTGKGAMLTIDNNTGVTLDRHYSGLYNNISASNYGIPYYDTVAVVKKQELLYIRISDYTIQRSARLNVSRPQDLDIVPVEALAFTLSSVYRLQNKKVVRDDYGDYVTISWASYNYHEDTVSRFVDSITITTDPTGILANQETITIRAYVRDQYGIAIAGKTLHFDKEYGDDIGIWGDINQEAISDINGVAEITYTSGWYDYSYLDDVNEDIKVTVYTDGSNILTGSIYVWSELTMYLNAKFILASDNNPYGVNLIKQIDNTFSSVNQFSQVAAFNSYFNIKAYSFFEFPGGHDLHQSLTKVFSITQLRSFTSVSPLIQEELFEGDLVVEQTKVASGECPVSQNYVSRHLSTGSNEDTVDIAQFRFIIDAVPEPFSEKNNVNANIWIKLAPYGFDLDQSTLIFRVREVSYAGDTGFISYVGTSNLQVVEYDAGGGLIGIEITYTPDEYFHNSALVYVYLEVYDKGIPANSIEFDYWFKVIPDYKAPYIINEIPYRGEIDVYVNQDVSFDILDTEVGVDIDTLDLYINNRIKTFTYEEVPNGYRVTYHNTSFYFDQIIEIAVRVQDTSGQDNVLYDMWKFYCESSLAPEVDEESLLPNVCVRGYDTRTTMERFNIYDVGGGLNKESIELIVDGKIRECKLIPVIKRIL